MSLVFTGYVSFMKNKANDKIYSIQSFIVLSLGKMYSKLHIISCTTALFSVVNSTKATHVNTSTSKYAKACTIVSTKSASYTLQLFTVISPFATVFMYVAFECSSIGRRPSESNYSP